MIPCLCYCAASTFQSNPAIDSASCQRADIAEGLAIFTCREPRFADIVGRLGPPPLRRAPEGLPVFAHRHRADAVAQSRDAICAGLSGVFASPLIRRRFLRRRDKTLMKLGLSGAKARTFQALGAP